MGDFSKKIKMIKEVKTSLWDRSWSKNGRATYTNTENMESKSGYFSQN